MFCIFATEFATSIFIKTVEINIMENVQWKVDGMTCSNCALTIHKFLEKEGLKNVKVNPIGGDVSFDLNEETNTQKIVKGIKDLGYQIENPDAKSLFFQIFHFR
jgi:Cu+-exporting ATPase